MKEEIKRRIAELKGELNSFNETTDWYRLTEERIEFLAKLLDALYGI